jgi:RNA polymerase sigma-70 factor (ECF subfamily)
MPEAWKAAASAAMERYARGEDAAFEELYDLLAPRLQAFLSRRTRDPARTEDLVQQTFLQMHSARHHFAPGAPVMPWAFAIARRLLIDSLRLGLREGDAPEGGRESMAPDAPADEVAARNRLMRRIEEQLARVSESDRSAFELVKCDGMSMAEAAAVLGISENAVKLRACRTYAALRAKLGDEAHEALEATWRPVT